MAKIGFTLAFFLFSSMFITAFAQAPLGCCVSSPNTDLACTNAIAQSDCAAYGTPFRWEQSYPICSDVPDKPCELGCKICSPPGGGTPTYNWGPKVLGCEDCKTCTLDLSQFTTISEQNCKGTVSGNIPKNLPNVTATVKDGNNILTSGTIVTCGVISSSTNINGVYRLVGCPVGTITVTATYTTSSGTKTGTAQVSLDYSQEKPVTINVAALQPKSITIYVINNSNKVPLDADVTIINNAQGQQQTQHGSVLTFSVIPGNVMITAMKQNYNVLSGAGQVDFSTVSKHNVTLERISTITLSGKIKDGGTQQGLSGAFVNVYFNNNLWSTTTSNPDGSYSINVPQSQTFRLTVSASNNIANFISSDESLKFDANSQHDVTLQRIAVVVKKVKVNITVIDLSNNNAISGVTVCTDAGCGSSARVLTDSNGVAHFNLDTGNAYTIFAYNDNYDVQHNFVQIPTLTKSTTATIYLTPVPRRHITGRVVELINGVAVPITDSKAKVSLSDGSSSSLGTGINAGKFDINTRYSPLPVMIFASAPSYLTYTNRICTALTGLSSCPANVATDIGDIVVTKSLCSDVNHLGDVTFTVVKNGNSAELEWSFDCPSTSISVLRGINSGSMGELPITPQPQASETYTDSNLVENAEYCYNVQAKYSINGEQGIVTNSQPICVTIGPSICFGNPNKQFCENGLRRKCTNNGDDITDVSPQCTAKETCIETSSGVTTCVPSDNCDYCNRPFGVFSERASSQLLFGAKYWSGNNNIGFYNCLLSATSTSITKTGCYKDASKTVVDKYLSCKDVKTCYDYASRDACESKKCNPTESCEWVDSAYGDLGIGVCRPTLDTGDQDCNEFSNALPRITQNSVYNKVFASSKGDVGRELCSLYGESCFYQESSNLCLNKDQVSCYNYDTKDTCIGVARRNVSVDVTWLTNPACDSSIENCRVYMSRGTNKVVQNSSDSFEIGLCKYVGTSPQNSLCIKDADDNYNKDVPEGETSDDCGDNAVLVTSEEHQNCALDVTPPVTTFTYPAYTNRIDFAYDVADDKSTTDQIQTYYSASEVTSTAPNTNDNYPMSLANEGILNGDAVPENEANLPYAILFFSRDRSHNLEKVKRINFIVDTLSPNVDFNFAVTPHTLDNQVDLAVNLKMDDTGVCKPTTGLVIGTKQYTPNESTLGATGQIWSEVYYDIPTLDNGVKATYTWDCFDKAGNPANGLESKQFMLDADNTISTDSELSSVTVPTGEDILVGIRTLYQGECRYTDNGPDVSKITDPYSEWTPFENTNEDALEMTGDQCNLAGCLHTTHVSIGSLNYKKFKVQCNLTGVAQPIQGRDGDDIRITVDNLPPKTVTKTLINNVEKDVTLQQGIRVWLKGSNLILKCNDTFQDGDFPREKGCGEVWFCSGPSCTPEAKTKDYQPIFSGTTPITFFSKDAFGNAETQKSVTVYIDNDPPIINLSGVLSQNSFDTQERKITLTENIVNMNRITGHRGSAAEDVSPIDTVYYESSYETLPGTFKLITNETLFSNKLPRIQSEDQFGAIPLKKDTATSTRMPIEIPLRDNSINRLKITVTDVAGNSQTTTRTAINDVAGPNITNALINFPQMTVDNNIRISSLNSTNLPLVDFGLDYDLVITGLEDAYPFNGNPSEKDYVLSHRVKSVYLKDVFGTRYDLELTPDGTWTTDLKTSGWPVTTKDFKTYVTVYATDILGNVASKKIDINVVDRIPPYAHFWLENKYGEKVSKVVQGMNFIVVNASEPLKLLNVKFSVPGKDFAVQFFAHDFDATTWTGIFDVNSTAAQATATGLLVDLHGLNSSDFLPIEPLSNPVDVKQLGIEEPIPITLTAKTNGIYYVNSREITYTLSHSDYTYQFSVNGKISTYSGTADITDLNNGLNNVSIKVEDKNDHDYKIFSHKILVDTSPPRITAYPTGSNPTNLRVDFTEDTGIDTAYSRLDIVNSTGGIKTVRLTDSSARSFPISLPSGTYEATLVLRDLAGNVPLVVPVIKFKTGTNLPGLTVTSADWVTSEGMFVTNKNPKIIATFSGATIDTTQVTITGNGQATSNALTPISNKVEIDPLLPQDGTYNMEISAAGSTWDYTIVKDSVSPQFTVFSPSPTNANPLSADAALSNSELMPLNGELFVDKVSQGTFTSKLSLDNRYQFLKILSKPAEKITEVSIKLTDKVNSPSTSSTVVAIDTTPPMIGKINVTTSGVKNLSNVLTSKEQTYEITGSYSDANDEIYAIGADGSRYDATKDSTTNTFAIDLRLIGRTFTETRNNIVLVFRDAAGNEARRQIMIVKDLKPPDLIELLFLRTI